MPGTRAKDIPLQSPLHLDAHPPPAIDLFQRHHDMTRHLPQIYHCEVAHRRLRPRQRGFTYRVFMLDVDPAALTSIARRCRFFSHNRFNVFSIDDADHIDLGHPGGILPNLAAWLEEHGKSLAAKDTVRLLTFPRCFGYGFNPVSFYYITPADGTPAYAVAEVVNTFREMKLYLVEPDPEGVPASRQPKHFYVSPFSDPGDDFDFHLGIPDEDWRVRIDNHDAEGLVLTSSIRGKSAPLTSARLFWCAVKYPLLSVKIIGLIHWHALRLWLKRVPFFRKSERREVQTHVLRPHE